MPITEEVYQAKYAPFVRREREERLRVDNVVVSHIRSMLQKRDGLRKNGGYEEADAIRRSLGGVTIMDGPNGTEWCWKGYGGNV